MTTQTLLAQTKKSESRFSVLDLIFAIFFCARHFATPIGRSVCHQTVCYLYAEHSGILAPTRFEIGGNLIFNREVDMAIEKLLVLSYIEPAEKGTYRITQSGLWQYDASIAPKITRDPALTAVLSSLRLVLREPITSGTDEPDSFCSTSIPGQRVTQHEEVSSSG